MRTSSVPETAVQKTGEMRTDVQTPVAAEGPAAEPAGQAAQGPNPVSVSAAENPAPGPAAPVSATPSAEADGRRILSTAFVRVGPDRHLTVELRDGRALVLRDVVMGPKDYCGVPVSGTPAGRRYCGRYAEVAAARPGGASAPGQSDEAGSNPAPSPYGPAGRH